MAKKQLAGVTFQARLESAGCVKIDGPGGGEIKLSFSQDAVAAVTELAKSHLMKNFQVAIVPLPDTAPQDFLS